MLQVYQAADRLEAQQLSDLLGEVGIANRIFGDYLSGAIGELPADLTPTVWVLKDADLQRARALIDDFLADNQTRAEAGSWVCRGCGELLAGSFDLCWRCGKPRPV